MVKKPAIIKYMGEPLKYQHIARGVEEEILTVGKLYEAYFLEYVEGVRNAVHVKCNDGIIRYHIHIEDFEIISDEDKVLNQNEAIVKCITHEFDDDFMYITYGKEYKVIGKHEDGSYLVMDDALWCYDYSADFFEIISDPCGILSDSVDCYWFYGKESSEINIDYRLAHQFSRDHRTDLEKDNVCGCFDCLRIFSPKEIEEWIPETEDGECVTAVCPYCGDDAIVGESSGYPITKEFLEKMNKKWFSVIE